MSRHQLESGFVLHRRPFRETSLLVEILTANHGRIGLVARGARRAKSSILEPFVPLRLSWSRRSDLGTLIGSEPDGEAVVMRGEPMMAGLYLNELLLKLLTRDDPHEALFADYRKTLRCLGSGESMPRVLRNFEIRLLEDAGYGLQLTHDFGTGEPVKADQLYIFDIESGPRRARLNERHDLLIHGDSLIAMQNGSWASARQLTDARRVLRAAIRRQLGATPLHTPQLMRDLSRFRAAAAPNGPATSTKQE